MSRQRDDFHPLTPAPRPPKTNSLPLKHEGYKTFFFLKVSHFRGHVNFQGIKKRYYCLVIYSASIDPKPLKVRVITVITFFFLKGPPTGKLFGEKWDEKGHE